MEGDKVRPDLVVPTPDEVTMLSDNHEQYLSLKPRFQGVDKHEVKHSMFFSYAFPCSKKSDVEDAYVWVRLQHLSATHVSCRARLSVSGDQFIEIGQDDGETQAELKIGEAITSAKLSNVAVFVVRYYGGVHLNKDRLPNIVHCARVACSKLIENSDPAA